jgi:hypothetical protein
MSKKGYTGRSAEHSLNARGVSTKQYKTEKALNDIYQTRFIDAGKYITSASRYDIIRNGKQDYAVTYDLPPIKKEYVQQLKNVIADPQVQNIINDIKSMGGKVSFVHVIKTTPYLEMDAIDDIGVSGATSTKGDVFVSIPDFLPYATKEQQKKYFMDVLTHEAAHVATGDIDDILSSQPESWLEKGNKYNSGHHEIFNAVHNKFLKKYGVKEFSKKSYINVRDYGFTKRKKELMGEQK